MCDRPACTKPGDAGVCVRDPGHRGTCMTACRACYLGRCHWQPDDNRRWRCGCRHHLKSADAARVDAATAGRTLIHPSARELDILDLLAAGRTKNAMARELGIAESSVAAASRSLYHKLGARSGGHAVHQAHLLGLLPWDRSAGTPAREKNRHG